MAASATFWPASVVVVLVHVLVLLIFLMALMLVAILVVIAVVAIRLGRIPRHAITPSKADWLC